MKVTIGALALLALLTCGLFVVFDLRISEPPKPRSAPLVPRGPQGGLPIPEKEFQPMLDNATQEVTHRFTYGVTLRNWSRIFGWGAVAGSALITLVAGFLGRAIKPDSQIPPTIEDVLGQQQQSAKIVRVIGVVIALSTACGLVSNRLESDAKTYASSAMELNKVVTKTTEILYDTQTTIPRARMALIELQVAMAQQ